MCDGKIRSYVVATDDDDLIFKIKGSIRERERYNGIDPREMYEKLIEDVAKGRIAGEDILLAMGRRDLSLKDLVMTSTKYYRNLFDQIMRRIGRGVYPEYQRATLENYQNWPLELRN